MSFNACVGTARAAGALAAIALVPSAAWAAPGLGQDEIPAGHLYFGFTAQAVQPFGRALIPREQLTLGRDGGLYLDYEEHSLIGAEIGGGRFGHDDTYSNPFILAIRAGPVFGSGRYAPYLAGGLAMLAYGAIGDDAATAIPASAAKSACCSSGICAGPASPRSCNTTCHWLAAAERASRT